MENRDIGNPMVMTSVKDKGGDCVHSRAGVPSAECCWGELHPLLTSELWERYYFSADQVAINKAVFKPTGCSAYYIN